MSDESRIIELLSEVAKAEAARRDIETERLSVTYEILGTLASRVESERRLEQIAALHLNMLQDALEEMVHLARETREVVALLLVIGDNDQGRDNLKTLVFQPGDRRGETEQLVMLHSTRLHRLREQSAKWGELHTPAHILTEIADTERLVEELQEKLQLTDQPTKPKLNEKK